MQQKTLRSLKPFITMCFGLMKPKCNHLAITKEGMFGENCWRRIHYALGMCDSWGLREYCTSGRKNGFHQILRNSRGNVQRSSQTLKLKRGWVFQQDNNPKHTSKSTMKYLSRFRNGHHSPQTWIRLKICGEISNAVHARRPKNISELEVFCQEEWGEIPTGSVCKRLSLPEEELQSTNWQGSQISAPGLFPFTLFLNCKNVL